VECLTRIPCRKRSAGLRDIHHVQDAADKAITYSFSFEAGRMGQ